MFIKINIQCKFLILFLSLVSFVSLCTLKWCLLDARTGLSTASGRHATSYLLQKAKAQTTTVCTCWPVCSDHSTWQACPVTLAGSETGRGEGKEMGAGKGILQWADMGNGCVWGR